jgi:hypothetical protein
MIFSRRKAVIADMNHQMVEKIVILPTSVDMPVSNHRLCIRANKMRSFYSQS